MKKILLIIAILGFITPTYAQIPRGNYGTLQPYTPSTGAIFGYVAGVITAKTIDTLSNVDTGLVRWNFNNPYNLLFDYTVTKISGTVAGTALLQASTDNINWNTITGNTTYCAGCIGASATVTNTAGTKHYQWFVPHDYNGYKYFQVQVISSGTMTATYAGSAIYSY